MKGLSIVILAIAGFQAWGFNCKYRFDNFEISLKPDSFFTFHQIDAPVRDIKSGRYYTHADSLVLTTHQFNGKEAILMILVKETELSVSVVYLQKELAQSRLFYPVKYYLYEEYYANHELKTRWYWQNYSSGAYEAYSFTPQKKCESIQRYQNFQLNGEQTEFYTDSKQPLPRNISEYKNNLKHGRTIYFEQYSYGIVAGKIETYKNGNLKSSKTPAIPQVFYTSRF
jgi:hypothetical protein